MVANFAAGGAAINQLARTAGAELHVIPLALDAPTADFTQQPALTEQEFLAAVAAGYDAVAPECDLICLGEMGIGNTTAAAAIAAALFGGGGARWAGRGTGVDDAGLERKRAVIDRALGRHAALLHDPLAVAAAFGGRELAAILGATLAARRQRIPVLLDGFVCTAAAAPIAKLRADALAHTLAGHISAEAGHRMLLDELGMLPVVDLNMRLGAGRQEPRWRSWSFARRWRVILGWRPSPRRACPTSLPTKRNRKRQAEPQAKPTPGRASNQVDFKNPQLFGKITGDQTTASFDGQPLMNLMLRLSW